jgi:hypothetical protein
MAEHTPEAQNWIAAAVAGAFGVLANVVQYFFHRGRSEDDDRDGISDQIKALDAASRHAQDRMETLHDEISRLRRDFENFRTDELRWQSSVDERILRIWRRIPAGSDGD